MTINRKDYIDHLFHYSWNGRVKIITGIRRSGKSFLLSVLYKQYLVEHGATSEQFIELDLEDQVNVAYRNPNKLLDYVLSKAQGNNQYYVFIDEIQRCYKVKNSDIDESLVPEEDREQLYTTFYDVLNSLRKHTNLDIYVTGSNSKMLSSDIVTYFRDRGDEIRVYPLSFAEYYEFSGLNQIDAFNQYLTYGGMPLAVLETDERKKKSYLNGLHTKVYWKDIVERYNLRDNLVLDALTDAIYSAVGSLSNPHRLADAASTLLKSKTNDKTIKSYIGYLEDAYLIHSAKRYNIKGKKYLEGIQKFYAMDLGLRNARLNFRQQDRGFLVENILYNELIRRGYSVDVGVVEVQKMTNGKRQQSQYEIDFVVNTGNEKIYIQSALHLDTEEKKAQELFSLRKTKDFFRKIVVIDGISQAWTDDEGITYVGVIPFLLNDILVL